MTNIVGTYNVNRAPGRPGQANAGDTVSITRTANPNWYSVTVNDGDGTPRAAWDRLDFEYMDDLEGCVRKVCEWDGEAHPHVMLLEVEEISQVRLASCRVVSLEDMECFDSSHNHPVSGAHYTGSWHGSD